ncbi:hypothetical protein pb186bvf_012753 [Paramecium bursaria]
MKYVIIFKYDFYLKGQRSKFICEQIKIKSYIKLFNFQFQLPSMAVRYSKMKKNKQNQIPRRDVCNYLSFLAMKQAQRNVFQKSIIPQIFLISNQWENIDHPILQSFLYFNNKGHQQLELLRISKNIFQFKRDQKYILFKNFGFVKSFK